MTSITKRIDLNEAQNIYDDLKRQSQIMLTQNITDSYDMIVDNEISRVSHEFNIKIIEKRIMHRFQRA